MQDRNQEATKMLKIFVLRQLSFFDICDKISCLKEKLKKINLNDDGGRLKLSCDV